MKRDFFSKKGFTLIELLVVISIISLLSSIVMASLNESREKARIAAAQQFDANVYHSLGDSAVGIWDLDDGGTQPKNRSGYDTVAIIKNSISNFWSYDPDFKKTVFRLDHTWLDFGYNKVFDSSEFTISFWVKPIEFVTGNQGDSNPLITREIYTVSGFTSFFDTNYRVGFWTYNYSGTIKLLSPMSSALKINKWNHVLISYGNGVGKIYLDGKLVAKQDGTYVIPEGLDLDFGEIGGKSYPNVYISGVKYYSRAIE